MLELDSTQIRSFIELDGISNIVVEHYLENLNLTIQYMTSRRALFGSSRLKEIETLFNIINPKVLLSDNGVKDKFVEVLLEANKNKRFIHVDNFSFSKAGNKIATRDFRILVDDLNGTVPRNELLHLASVATMMLSNIIEYPIGYDYIQTIMKKYGYTNFRYQGNGYLHITIGDSIGPISSMPPRVDGIPKK